MHNQDEKTLLNLLVLVVLSSGAVRAVEPAPTTPDHPTPYQRAVRAALVEHGWSIIGEKAGRLVAEQPLKDTYGTLRHFHSDVNDSYAHLFIDFHPSSNNPTDSTVYATLCIYKMREKFELAYPMMDLHDPNVDQDYRDIVAEARSHLAGGHHARAADRMDDAPDTNHAKSFAVK